MFVIALLPILWLVLAMCVLKMSAWKACSLALVISLIVAIPVFGMVPLDAATAVLEGIALACWPILLVVIATIFTYNLAVGTRAMETIKQLLTSVSSDKRVLALLIGWGFGGFMEGMAGFGTAIAIPAGMLVSIGFNPVIAAVSCLIANSVPTAYGSIGIPLITLANVTGTDATQLATYTAVQLAPLNLLCPPLIVMTVGKSFSALKGVGIITLAASLGFLLPELAVSYFMGPDLAVVAAAVCTMGIIVVTAKLFPVKDPKYKLGMVGTVKAKANVTKKKVTTKKAIIACLPFILIFFFLLFTSKLFPFIHDPLASIKSSVLIYTGEGGVPYTFTWVATPGVLILLAAIIGGKVQEASNHRIFWEFVRTVKNLIYVIISIVTVIATAKVMGYSGMTQQIADAAVAATGTGYPAIAALIGSVGTFITGSATSSCVLFGNLQTSAAQAIGASPNAQAWIAAANATGACAGKMISPQSIAIALGAIGTKGIESQLMGSAIKYYIPFVVAMGAIVYFGQNFIG
ncbi:MAG: lactate permease LctP family transporter [Selenomonadaceae bacterium]|nr:lactate permease LctP family transporter [Selenomonadaceae bacterium]